MPPADTDDDLRVLLDDLETTLSALRAELRADGDAGRGGDERDRQGDRRGLPRRPDRTVPRPPSLPELFRFTEQYTLPTVIAMLEATIRSLELLRGVLRLADPERSAFEGGANRRESRGTESPAALLGDGVAGVGREAVSGVERALAELQTALSESDLPEDRTSSELLEDARRLSEEVADRLAETRRERVADRYGYRREERRSTGADADRGSNAASAGVVIDVDDESGSPETARNDEDGEPDEPGGFERAFDAVDGSTERDEEAPRVDVESELASIKDEVERRSVDAAPASGGDEADEDADGPGEEADGENDTEAGGEGGEGDTEAAESDS